MAETKWWFTDGPPDGTRSIVPIPRRVLAKLRTAEECEERWRRTQQPDAAIAAVLLTSEIIDELLLDLELTCDVLQVRGPTDERQDV